MEPKYVFWICLSDGSIRYTLNKSSYCNLNNALEYQFLHNYHNNLSFFILYFKLYLIIIVIKYTLNHFAKTLTMIIILYNLFWFWYSFNVVICKSIQQILIIIISLIKLISVWININIKSYLIRLIYSSNTF